MLKGVWVPLAWIASWAPRACARRSSRGADWARLSIGELAEAPRRDQAVAAKLARLVQPPAHPARGDWQREIHHLDAAGVAIASDDGRDAVISDAANSGGSRRLPHRAVLALRLRIRSPAPGGIDAGDRARVVSARGDRLEGQATGDRGGD